jgi:hypothetical protein
LFHLSYAALAIIILFIVLPLLLIFSLLAVSSREEEQLAKMARTRDLAAISKLWPGPGGMSLPKPRNCPAGGKVAQPTESLP